MDAAPDVLSEELVAAGVTPREVEVFWLVAERLRNSEIADRLFVSERTVESHVASLLRKLGVTDRWSLVDLARRIEERAADRLPAELSSFVGREGDLAELRRLVPHHRLVTLTGAAGAGKTRLALQLGRSANGMPSAVLVELATVPVGGDVARAFADAVGLVEDPRGLSASLRTALADGRHWLLVDNCEHVLEQVTALLTDLLTATSGLSVLATSRIPLRISGEVVYEVAPLPVPEESDEPGEILGVAAGRLFADRAATASPGFTVAAGQARDVAALCHRLDGLPLAIELAAARIRTFSPSELLSHLDDRFNLLTDGAPEPTGRHRTLEAALRWSYDLLDEQARLLLERCSVFPGEFDYDSAVEVLAMPPLDADRFLGTFSQLLDHSLVSSRRREDGPTRYRMLETVREFAGERLVRRGEDRPIRERHASHHLRTAVVLLPHLKGGDQVAALGWFDRRWVDLHAAMRWTLANDETELAWEFLAGIATAWEIIGIRGEVFDLLDVLLERPLPEGELGTRAGVTASFLLNYKDPAQAMSLAQDACDNVAGGRGLAHALTSLALGWAMYYRGEPEVGARHLRTAAEEFQELGDTWHRTFALQGLGFCAQDVEAAIGHLSESVRLFGRMGDQVMQANCLFKMAARCIDVGVRLDDAEGWLQQAVVLAERTANTHELLHVRLYQARLRQESGQGTDAVQTFRDVLSSMRRMGDRRCVSRCLFGLGREALAAGDDEAAYRHLGECVTVAAEIHNTREMAAGLGLLARLEHRAGHSLRAAELLGAADVAADNLDRAGRTAVATYPQLRDDIREQVGTHEYNSAFARGRRTGMTDVTELLRA